MDDYTSLPGPDSGIGAAVIPDDAVIAAAEPSASAQAPGAGGVPGNAAPGAPEPVYTAVEDWVTGYFLPMFRRTLGGEYRWCAQWWQHGEAISRLTSLWHAWEVLRHQPGTGIATWYRDHLDHQLPILMGARGPFYQCAESAHREPREAIAVPAPGDWWDIGDDDGSVPGGGAEEPGRGVNHDIA
jgi:Domain of unknown function (DUF4913)